MAKVQVKRSKNNKLKVTGKKSSSRQHEGSGRQASEAKAKARKRRKHFVKKGKVVYDQARVDLLAWLI